MSEIPLRNLSITRLLLSVVPFTLLAAILTGCGMGTLATNAPVISTHLGALGGRILGGQQPVVGAHVYLFAAGTTGYGGASTSLLSSALTGHSDAVGGYVLTDVNGSFSLTGDYTCVANTQVYAYALGGNPGSGTNSMSGLMAVLGNCPSTGTLAMQTPIVYINEVSTVAAAYAFAGYAVDATHVSSSGTAAAQTGIANAFANAALLNDIASSAGALVTTPGGNGTPPQSLVNTLANILAACINSSGPTSTPCATIKADAVSSTGGAQPTDTATAAINMAHRPGNQVAALYGVTAANTPFQPSLPTQPADFTVTIAYSGAGHLSNPAGLAVDANGSVWVTNPGASQVVQFSPTGTVTASVVQAGSIKLPMGIAVDPSGKIWFNDNGSKNVYTYTPSTQQLAFDQWSFYSAAFQPFFAVDGSGNTLTLGTDNEGSGVAPVFFYDYGGNNKYTYPTYASKPVYAVAVDTKGYFWATSNDTTVTSGARLDMTKITSLGTNSAQVAVNSCTGTNYAQGTGIVVDSGNNIWIADHYTSKLVEFANSCTYNTSLSTIGAPKGLAIDGNNTLWTINASNQLGAVTTSGTAVSPTGGYAPVISGTLVGPVIDGSGNVWFADTTNNTLQELIGIATPVVTPLSVGAATNKLGSRP